MNVENVIEVLAALAESGDTDDLTEEWQIKLAAYKRYRNNHLLMSRIMDGQVVPDVSRVVTEKRLAYLKKQVETLLSFKDKLDIDMEEMKLKHENRLIKIKKDSEQYVETINTLKASNPLINPEYERELEEKYYQEMKSQLLASKENPENKLPETDDGTEIAGEEEMKEGLGDNKDKDKQSN